MAAGLLLTVGIYQAGLDMPKDHNTSDMTGTIANSSPPSQNRIQFNTENLQGAIRLDEQNGLQIVDVNIDSPSPVTIAIDFDAQSLRYKGINQIQNQVSEVVGNDQTVNIVSLGEQHFFVEFSQLKQTNDAQVSPLKLKIHVGGKLIQQFELEID